ncbi:lipopolysaccharide biosynthesis protein [Anaeromyxobacter sp. Red801]|uniref:lipopolysaccharide biosynthesis protein n=1 Tax=Anaeromyxobacter sp. Red801 TaxID=3411632 RepID=UPI003BA1255E
MTALGYPIYLHYLGFERYGVWIVLSTVLSFVQLTNLGIGPAVTSYVAAEHAAGRTGGVQRYATTAVCAVTSLGLLVVAVVYSVRHAIVAAFKVSGPNAESAQALVPFVALLSVYVFVVQVHSATIAGLGRMDLSATIDAVGRIVALLVSTLLLVGGLRLEAMLVGSVFSYVVVHTATSLVLVRGFRLSILRVRSFSLTALRDLLRFGAGIIGSSILVLLLHPSNRLIVARSSGVASLPVYEIAFSAAMQIRSLLESGFRAIAPEVGRLASRTRQQMWSACTRMAKRSTALVLVLGAPAWLVLWAVAIPAFKLWLGQRYMPELPAAFRAMLVGTYCGLLGVPWYYILIGLRRTDTVFAHHLLQTISNAVALFAISLSGTIAPLDAAVAASFGMAVANLYLAMKGRRAVEELACA